MLILKAGAVCVHRHTDMRRMVTGYAKEIHMRSEMKTVGSAGEGSGSMIDLTKDQCESLVDLIEVNLFDIIRNDPDIDGFDWLVNIVDAYKVMKKEAEQ